MAVDDNEVKAITLSNLPRDVESAHLQAYIKGFVHEVRNVHITPTQTKADKSSSHAVIVVEANKKELEVLERNVRKGCFGRSNVGIQISKKKKKKKKNKNKNASKQKQGGSSKTNGGEDIDPPPSDNYENHARVSYKIVAKKFHSFLFEEENHELLVRCSDREELGNIFKQWADTTNQVGLNGSGKIGRHSFLVMSELRKMKLLKSERIGAGSVLCVFAKDPGYFLSKGKQKIKERVLESSRVLESGKWGVSVSVYPETDPDNSVVSPGESFELCFTIVSSSEEEENVILKNVVLKGPSYLRISSDAQATLNQPLEPNQKYEHRVIFCAPTGSGVHRATLSFHLERKNSGEECKIVQYLLLRSGDKKMQEKLKPTAPYIKKKTGRRQPVSNEKALPPPKDKGSGGGAPSIVNLKLPQHRIPFEFKIMLEAGELDGLLTELKPTSTIDTYGEFWQHLLWASEHQANRDIILFDMEDASLFREGIFYRLTVPGLAEGRPSVLRGDLVHVTCNGQLFWGRVKLVREVDVLMELHRSFSGVYLPGMASLHVRFTFSRTIFRTTHQGCLEASTSMGKRMLLPDLDDISSSTSSIREIATNIRWANPTLNDEQQSAVRNILLGSGRPIPYIIFGPPGTGKTTTVAEAVYQLAKHPDQMKILLVAPSNDAADILVSKLSRYFPPSEMRRILAFSRSIDTVPTELRAYYREGQSELEQQEDIMSARIVVSTMNLAARFSFLGVPKGHFSVLCIDEAGHATEPEVVAVAATLMDFNCENSNQLILAGDPKQLGPIIPSGLCQKFGMSMSYMERLTLREAYGRADGNYPPALLTKLVRNYRSHPEIIKLPNELFYDNELEVHGDKLSTHSLARWEHLPTEGFPILFHAVHGENLREATSPSWFNPQEAAEVAHYVDLLIKQTRPAIAPEDIGIITPYNRQVHKIRTALKVNEIKGVKVGSVETFQGQERRVIIISTVRAENEFLESDRKYNLGFVSNEKRFNVAVTRAQSLLIVIGHPKVLASDKKSWLPLLRFCKENGAWLGEDWDENDSEDSSDELAETFAQLSVDKEFLQDEAAAISQHVEQEGMVYINREE
jgi:helicase MOV-10